MVFLVILFISDYFSLHFSVPSLRNHTLAVGAVVTVIAVLGVLLVLLDLAGGVDQISLAIPLYLSSASHPLSASIRLPFS